MNWIQQLNFHLNYQAFGFLFMLYIFIIRQHFFSIKINQVDSFIKSAYDNYRWGDGSKVETNARFCPIYGYGSHWFENFGEDALEFRSNLTFNDYYETNCLNDRSNYIKQKFVCQYND